MRLQVRHQTTYRFDPPMRGVVQSHRLTPSLCENQTVLSWDVTVAGSVAGAAFRDGAGDAVSTISVLEPLSELVVEITGEVETRDLSGVLTGHKEKTPRLAYLRPSRLTKPSRALRELAAAAVADIPAEDGLAKAHALAAAVADAIVYKPGETFSETSGAEALELGYGVCQDHAHALIGAAIAVDIPGRYVTGYLFSTADGSAMEASHAWAELYVPGLGWVGFDPSNRCCPDEKYIRLGSGGDAVDAAPIRGISQGAGTETLETQVSVAEAAQ